MSDIQRIVFMIVLTNLFQISNRNFYRKMMDSFFFHGQKIWIFLIILCLGWTDFVPAIWTKYSMKSVRAPIPAHCMFSAQDVNFIFCKLRKPQKHQFLFLQALKTSKNMNFIFCKLKKPQKTWISFFASLKNFKKHWNVCNGVWPFCVRK